MRLQRVRLDGKGWLHHHHEFHDFLCEITGQQRLLKEIRRLRAAVEPYLLVYINIYRQTEMAGTDHEVLIDSIASRNPQLAERTYVSHVESAASGVLAFLESRHDAAGSKPRSRKSSS
jgi:DNA-binding GntR family transcriptional regulator